jgi:hypothetical protein
MGSAGAFEWQGQECRGVYFLFMFTTLPFACVCSLSVALSMLDGQERFLPRGERRGVPAQNDIAFALL